MKDVTPLGLHVPGCYVVCSNFYVSGKKARDMEGYFPMVLPNTLKTQSPFSGCGVHSPEPVGKHTALAAFHGK